ncbi:alpha/beta hydrolase family protein [Rhodococcus tibetensis]|uniref:Prolyl oligopeptidase family serine peptidase n=1 Tax=Rhodococcus tibetensis TaxID=2965064 RepID=A0ABT1Q9C5_9NOCA|nr:prolyl oligopeptidase family serine peptidase [Rhodococcus sp. FXJ9.536]MCQ4118852.1 prolyl oligopeptidase family serine peptidase [Rhodococcus sp. FXJ9.536]
MDRIRIAYGTEPQQFGHFYAPEEPVEGPVPVVMVVHGGFWSGKYHLNLGTSFAVDLARHGVAVWNIEYRRLGAGGAWNEMSADIVAALEALAGPVAEQSPVAFDFARVRVVGHSAGGQLAVWLASQTQTAVRPEMVVSQAGALDLASAGERGRRIGYIEDLLGVPFADDPDRYRSASPYHRIPIGVPVVCVHGTEDIQVPAKVSVRYSDAAQVAGDPVALHLVDGEDHYAFLSPDSECWKISRHALLAGPADG